PASPRAACRATARPGCGPASRSCSEGRPVPGDVGMHAEASPMTERQTLIIAKTPDEALDHTRAHHLHDWKFVADAADLEGAEPATHAIAFVGRWYERTDLQLLRRLICGRGFDAPH